MAGELGYEPWYFSVVISDFNLAGAFFSPNETNSVLFVNANAELAFSVSRERFEPISRWDPQFFDIFNRIKLIELSSSYAPEVFGANFSSFPRVHAIKNIFAGLICE